MPPPQALVDLVDRFDRNAEAYRSGQYNEAQVRTEFIDPFFDILGWDVANRQGTAEAYKDVTREISIKVGAETKAPDYCFRVGGTPKFFVEAKKPAVNLKQDQSAAFQLRRYAWSRKLPVSLLTSFAELAVFDCRIGPPSQSDKASAARILYFTYRDYLEMWDEIAGRFSRDAVLKGFFDKYVESAKLKRGTSQVDTAFLGEIQTWRKELASNIALRNPELASRELNFAVQRTIDRVIFLRICEDRGIEPYGQLRELQNSGNIYQQLCVIFQRADDKYNSGLFQFQAEKDRNETPDELTLTLRIDDDRLKRILKRLYYPDSPYEFSVLPADILGQVYEQFLGQVIRLTASHQAKVEDKPEVKKAGGVYYTPTYIVDYMVNNTVGRLVETKTVAQVSKLRILDPACGSGSFLIGAFQYLVDWHRDWYTANGSAKHSKELYRGPAGEWRLTITEKKRILLNNIFGVDVDLQAVEVTKLSLLLKVLEGESDQTLNTNLRLFHERALPDLGRNIKCGNSLIAPDFYEGKQLSFLDEDGRYRINAFDWNSGFPEIMRSGGFEAVIGNPPYVDIKALPTEDVSYIFRKYQCANNRINLFAAFIEQSLRIVRQKDFRFSMIIPTALLTQDSYSALRKQVTDHYDVCAATRLPNESFGASAGDVKVDTVIVVLRQKQNVDNAIEILSYAGYDRISKIDPATAQGHGHLEQKAWRDSADHVWALNLSTDQQEILKKCALHSIPLDNCAEFSLGLTPYDKYKGHTPHQIEHRAFHATFQKDKTFRKLLAGNDVCRYWSRWNGEEWISYGPWLGAPREQRFFSEKRILVKQIIDWTSKRIWATITDKELYNTQNAFNLLARSGWSLEYLLGILNSKLITFYHRKKYLDEFKMRFQKVLIKDCRRLPIHALDRTNPKERRHYDELIELVVSMLRLNEEIHNAKTEPDRVSLRWKIESTDREIDRLVYEFYGLTKVEVAVVEASFRAPD